MNIITTSVYSIGGTFIDWSINFLAGFTEYYNIKQKQYIPLSLNPISKLNAHEHYKNHPLGFIKTAEYLDHISQLDQNKIYSLYPYPMRYELAAFETGIAESDIQCVANQAKIIAKQNSDYQSLIDMCLSTDNTKVIFVNLNKNYILYTHYPRDEQSLLLFSNFNVGSKDYFDHYSNLFFKEDNSVEEIWDRRERLALSMRPFDSIKTPNLKHNHLWVEAHSLWFNGEATIRKIMDYVNLPIVNERLTQWNLIYREWIKTQTDLIEFSHNYTHIIDAIVNDWYYVLPELSFHQEIIIQHCLIYFHNLNLKNWQLSKFPSNTKDLHKLLEPNTHPIPKLY